MSKSTLAIVVVLAAMLGASGVLISQAPHRLLSDDVYFYLLVGENSATGNGTTFNGIYETNGYHPLWQLIVSGLFLVLDRTQAVPIAIWVGLALAAAGAALFFRAGRRLFGTDGWIGSALLLAIFVSGMHLSEAHLNLFCSAFLLWLVVRWESERVPVVLLSLAGALSLLSRLDNVFYVALMLILAARWSPGETRRRAILGGVGAVLFVAPYFLWNTVTFGHPLPISGLVKSSLPVFGFSLWKLGVLGFVMTGVSLAGLIVFWRLRRHQQFTAELFLVLSLSVGAQVLYTGGFTAGSYWRWYWVIGFLETALLVDLAAQWVRRHSAGRHWLGAGTFDRLAAAVAILLLLVGGVRVALRSQGAAVGKNPFALELSELGSVPTSWPERLEADLAALGAEPGDVIWAGTAIGALGWNTPFRVLPFDGLMGNLAYDRELEELGGQDFADRKGIRYLLIRDPVVMEPIVHITPLLTSCESGKPCCLDLFTPVGRKWVATLALQKETALLQYPRPLGEVLVFDLASVDFSGGSCPGRFGPGDRQPRWGG